MNTKLTKLIESSMLRYAALIREERYEDAFNVAGAIASLSDAFASLAMAMEIEEFEKERGKGEGWKGEV